MSNRYSKSKIKRKKEYRKKNTENKIQKKEYRKILAIS